MTQLSSIIESILFASGDPVPIKRMSLVLGKDEDEIINAVNELICELQNGNHGLKIVRIGDKFQMCSDSDNALYITKTLETRKPPMLSGPALETLSIIAYFQPTTLAYISKVRGVDSSYTVSSLLDRNLVGEIGRLDAPGRPILYGTTDAFLRTMGIKDLSELPPLPDLSSNSAMDELKAKIDSLQSMTDNNIKQNEQEEVTDK